MKISNFDNVFVGSEFPVQIRISKLGYHETYGMVAECGTSHSGSVVEIRLSPDGETIALITAASQSYMDGQIAQDSFWKNSTLIWRKIDASKC